MSLNFPAIQDALFKWCSTTLGADVAGNIFWFPFMGTKLPKPSVMLKLVGPEKKGFTDNFDGTTLAGPREATLTVETFSDPDTQIIQEGALSNSTASAQDLASRLLSSVDDPNVIDALQDKGIGIGGVTPITDISELLDTKYESRQHFEITLHLADTRTSLVDTGNGPDAGQILAVEVDTNLGGH